MRFLKTDRDEGGNFVYKNVLQNTLACESGRRWENCTAGRKWSGRLRILMKNVVQWSGVGWGGKIRGSAMGWGRVGWGGVGWGGVS